MPVCPDVRCLGDFPLVFSTSSNHYTRSRQSGYPPNKLISWISAGGCWWWISPWETPKRDQHAHGKTCLSQVTYTMRFALNQFGRYFEGHLESVDLNGCGSKLGTHRKWMVNSKMG
jgi:hypothetical protein